MVSLVLLYRASTQDLRKAWDGDALGQLGLRAVTGLSQDASWDTAGLESESLQEGVYDTRFGVNQIQFYASRGSVEQFEALARKVVATSRLAPEEVVLIDHVAEMSGPVVSYFGGRLTPDRFLEGALGNVEIGIRQLRLVRKSLIEPKDRWVAAARKWGTPCRQSGDYLEFDFDWTERLSDQVRAGAYDCWLPWPDDDEPDQPAGGYFYWD